MAAKTISSLAIAIGVDLSGFEKNMKEFNKTWGKIGKQAQDIGMKVSVAFTAAGGAIATGLGFAVNKAMDFDAEMSRVGAISGATSTDLASLRKAALDLGASTSKSASEVAQGMELMAAKGYDAQQVIAAMPGVIAASEASGEDMALVADTVASALNAFGLAATDATKVADIMAVSANTSAAGIEDLQFAFKYAAPVAKNLGVSIEQLAAATGIMADNGMKGEQAGTTLRAALLRLADPPKEAAAELQALGISVTDASGKFLPLDKIIGQLKTSTDGMSNAQKAAALSTIFGTEAVTGMLSVVEAGPAKFNALTQELQKSGGASADTAAKMKDNLAGSVQELNGAVETLEISMGSALSPAIQKVADGLTGLVNWFNSLSPQTQKMIAYGAAFAAILMLVVGALAAVVAVLGVFAAAEWAAILPIAGFIAAAVAVIAVIAALAYVIYSNWDSIAKYTTGIWDGIKGYIQSTWDTIAGIFTGIWDVIGPAFKAGWEGMTMIIKAYFDTWKTIITAAWDIIKTIFTAAFLVIYYLVTGQWDKIGGVFKAAGEKILNIVSGAFDHIKQVWGNVFDWFVNAALAGWSNIKQAFVDAWGGIKNFFMNLPGEAYNMGKDLISGMINGIASMAGALVQKAKDVVNGAVKAAKNFLGINSPSKVFMELGGWTGEGFAIGLEDTASMVGGAAVSMATPALDSVQSLPSPGVNGGGGSASQPMTVIFELDGKTVARSTLNYMGGTFRVKGAVT